MNLLFCGDENVTDGIMLSVLSLCKSTKEPMSFYILTANVVWPGRTFNAISPEFAESLRRLLARKGRNDRVYLFDISDSFFAEMPLANMDTRFTPLCMLRLFADTVPEIPDRILYLDTDVLCRRDFKDFYEMDMGNADIAGVPDRYGKWLFGNILRHDYLNSGVLLMNMKNIRADGMLKKCRRVCREEQMLLPDQSALNKLAIKKIVSRIYNEQDEIAPDTVFKHFTAFFVFFPLFHVEKINPMNTERLHDELEIFEFDDILYELKGQTKPAAEPEQEDELASSFT